MPQTRAGGYPKPGKRGHDHVGVEHDVRPAGDAPALHCGNGRLGAGVKLAQVSANWPIVLVAHRVPRPVRTAVLRRPPRSSTSRGRSRRRTPGPRASSRITDTSPSRWAVSSAAASSSRNAGVMVCAPPGGKRVSRRTRPCVSSRTASPCPSILRSSRSDGALCVTDTTENAGLLAHGDVGAAREEGHADRTQTRSVAVRTTATTTQPAVAAPLGSTAEPRRSWPPPSPEPGRGDDHHEADRPGQGEHAGHLHHTRSPAVHRYGQQRRGRRTTRS